MGKLGINPITVKLDLEGSSGGGGGGGGDADIGLVIAYLTNSMDNITGDRTPVRPIFDTVIINTNNAYDPITGIYTAPSTGKYAFNVQLTFLNLATEFNEGTLIAVVNGINQQYSYYDPVNFANKYNGTSTLNQTGVLNLISGDQVSFSAIIGNGAKQVNIFGNSLGGPTSIFSIYKIDASSGGGGGSGGTGSLSYVEAYLNTAQSNVTGDGTEVIPVWDTTFKNVDGLYDTSTGIFTVPVTGSYLYIINIAFSGQTASHNSGYILTKLEGGTRQYQSINLALTSPVDVNQIISQSNIVKLTAGTTLSFSLMISGGAKTVNIMGLSALGVTTTLSIALIEGSSSGGGGGGAGITDVTATNIGANLLFETIGTTKNLKIADANSNMFLGSNTGNQAISGYYNIAWGVNNLFQLVSGDRNLAFGVGALISLINGSNNTAFGDLALRDCQGSGNTALGSASGANLTSGSNNVYLGLLAGQGATTESNNVIIGALVPTETGVSNQITIGSNQNSCKIAGIANVTIPNSDLVTIDRDSGKMGSFYANPNLGTFKSNNIGNIDNITGDGTPYNVVMQQVPIDYEGKYNLTTGEYVIPSTGKYYVNMNITLQNLISTHTGATILFKVNGVGKDQRFFNPWNSRSTDLGYCTLNYSNVDYLTKDDVLTFALVVSGGTKTVTVGFASLAYTTSLSIFKVSL